MQIYSNYLFGINQGSNTLSMFTISSSDATSVTLTSNVIISQRYPVSVAVSSTHACVLTNSDDFIISCFNYNSSGLLTAATASYNISSYLQAASISTSRMPKEILFSKDGGVLLTSIPGTSALPNKILFFKMINGTLNMLRDYELNNSRSIDSMRLVDTNSLLLVSTLYSNNPVTQFVNFTSTNISVAPILLSPLPQYSLPPLYYSVYSPKTDNYYAFDSSSYGIMETKLNLSATQTDLFSVASYYLSSCMNSFPLDNTIVTYGDADYMFVINQNSRFMSSYQFKAGSDPIGSCFAIMQQRTTNPYQIVGIAAYIPTGRTSSSVRTRCSWIILAVISLVRRF